jgi:oligoendopeptidase F
MIKVLVGSGVAVVILSVAGCGASTTVNAPVVNNAQTPTPTQATVDPNKQLITDIMSTLGYLSPGFTDYGTSLTNDANQNDYTAAESDTQSLLGQVDQAYNTIQKDDPTDPKYQDVKRKYLHILSEIQDALKKVEGGIQNNDANEIIQATTEVSTATSDLTNLSTEVHSLQSDSGGGV